ncbi:MAG: LamG domain-containing protein, partial [Planctomycetota bacterium]
MSRELICLMSFILALSIAGNASADLVAHWKLDEGSGNTVYDSGTSGNDGTFESDPQWAAGYYGGGLEFDGTDNIDCGNDDSLNITGEITLSAWINMAQRPAVDSWYTIPWKENAYSMYLYGADNTLTTLCADFWLDTGRADIWDGPDTDVPPNEWTHIAVTFNGTDFEFYVNGEHDHTQNQPGTIEISAINFLFTQAGSNF